MHQSILSGNVQFDEHPSQHLTSSYDFPSFELSSPANDSDLEEQHVEVLPPLPKWGQRRTKFSLQRTRVFMNSASNPEDFCKARGIVEWDIANEESIIPC